MAYACPRSSTERVRVGPQIQGIERRVFGLLDRGLREIDRIKGVDLGPIGVLGRLPSVEPLLFLLDGRPHLGDMGLPFAADVVPLRRRLIAGPICLGLELIGRRGRLVSRNGRLRRKLIPGLLTGRAQLACRRFRFVRNLFELPAQIGVCHPVLPLSSGGLIARHFHISWAQKPA
jgi:hypothetical protein